jgi:transposase
MKEVYIGIDAHKESNQLAYAFEGREKATLIGKVSADLNRTLDTLRKFQKKHDLTKEQLHICYEAGPTGFVLARRLIGLGYDCIVIAPSKTPKKSGDKVRTDRRMPGSWQGCTGPVS